METMLALAEMMNRTRLHSVSQHAHYHRPGPCPCACNSGGFCGGCGHAGCGGRR